MLLGVLGFLSRRAQAWRAGECGAGSLRRVEGWGHLAHRSRRTGCAALARPTHALKAFSCAQERQGHGAQVREFGGLGMSIDHRPSGLWRVRYPGAPSRSFDRKGDAETHEREVKRLKQVFAWTRCGPVRRPSRNWLPST